jgi:hypothetical protein
MAENQMKSSLTLFVCSSFSDHSMAKHNPHAAQPEQDGRIDDVQRQLERVVAGSKHEIITVTGYSRRMTRSPPRYL